MSDVQSWREEIKPLNAVMIFVVVVTVLGVCFLTSPPPDRTPAGATPWAEGSLLKAITDALAFDFSIPTPLGLGVKNLSFGVASGLAAVIVSLGLFSGMRSREFDFTLEEDDSRPKPAGTLKRQIDPAQGAQLLFITLVAYSFASCLWAPLAELAVGGSVILLGHCLWVFAIRFGLNARSCQVAAIGLVTVLVAVAALAVAYFYERNETMRVGYPIGNPLFFAACLIPAVLLCIAWIASAVQVLMRGRYRALGTIGLCLSALVPILWGIKLADPRSTYMALAAGLVCMVFFAVRGAPRKLAVVGASVVVGVAGYLMWLEPLLAHRSETIRTRLYAWSYAQELIAQAPILGHGQGGFALLGDALARNDVSDDPRALHAHLAHAHNEWLEICADLGSLGLVITLGCYVLTLWAGVAALRKLMSPGERWLLIGLLASLSALIVEECADVALRIAGLPTVFYTVLGMSWAMIASAKKADITELLRARKSIFQSAVVIGVAVLGMLVSVAAVLDFRASRALYEFRERIAQRQWDAAMEDAQVAAQFRLSPNRKLGAYYSQAWCHLRIAEELLRELELRVASPAVQQDSGPAPALKSYAPKAVERSTRAIELSAAISQHAQHYYGVHRLAGASYEILRHVALLLGEEDRAEQFRNAAVEQLRAELARLPFDAELVRRLIEFSPDLAIAEIIELICAPMRYHQVDLVYFQIVQALARRPDFALEFDPILSRAMTQLIDSTSGETRETYAAQKLRIAAWVHVGRGNASEAVGYARMSLALAEKERTRFPIAYAIAHRELAHFMFLDDPSAPLAAIELAEQSNALLPDSHEAAPVRERTTHRLAMYQLAHGNEQAVRALVPGHDRLRPEALDAEMTSVCLSLCQLITTMPAEKRPEYFRARLNRLSELARGEYVSPEIKVATAMLEADVALQQKDLAGCIDHWKTAMSNGIDPRQILSMAQQAQEIAPEDALLQDFVGQLNAALTGSDSPGGSQ